MHWKMLGTKGAGLNKQELAGDLIRTGKLDDLLSKQEVTVEKLRAFYKDYLKKDAPPNKTDMQAHIAALLRPPLGELPTKQSQKPVSKPPSSQQAQPPSMSQTQKLVAKIMEFPVRA